MLPLWAADEVLTRPMEEVFTAFHKVMCPYIRGLSIAHLLSILKTPILSYIQHMEVKKGNR